MLKNIVTALLFGVLTANIAQGAEDPKNIGGFGKTAWGMTQNEILKAEASRAEKLENPEEYAIGLGLVEIKEILIGTNKFNVIFIFDRSDQKLKQVNVKCLDENAAIGDGTFLYIAKLLTEKYGAPTFTAGTKEASWKLPKTSIELKRTFISRVISHLMIMYRPAITNVNAASDL